MDRGVIERQIQFRYAVNQRLASRSLSDYLDQVVIDSRPEARRYGEVAEGWQRERDREIVPALESVAGMRTGYSGPTGFVDVEPRGHDKTSRIGRYLNGLLAFSRRPLRLITAAADQDQAGLIVESMTAEQKLNPWIGCRIKSGQKRVIGPGGSLKVLSSDAPTSSGLNADIYILDEITWWKKPDLWNFLLTAWIKRPGSVMVIITNAGVRGSWQDQKVRQLAKADPQRWAVYETPEYVRKASWIDEELLQSTRRGLPRGFARRVYDNVWIDPAEEADYLTREEIRACELLGIDLGLSFQPSSQPGHSYVVGVDYGPKRDRTVLSVVHLDHLSRVVVDRMDVWQGSPDSPILVERVEEWIDKIWADYRNPTFVIDPYQLEGTIQKREGKYKIERFESRGGKRNYEMAENLRSLIVSKRLVWYSGAGNLVTDNGVETFADELAGLVVKPTPYGYRFDTEPQDGTIGRRSYHDDRAVSVGMAALVCCREGNIGWVAPQSIKEKTKLDLRLRPTKPGVYGVR